MRDEWRVNSRPQAGNCAGAALPPQAFKGRRGEAALWAVGPKKKGMTIGHALLFGGGEEIRTLAPAKPTYRISNHATNP